MEYRGYDSAGVAALVKGRIKVLKGVGKVAEVNAQFKLDSLPGTVAIGHTRWATHGGVTDYNAHPHMSAFGRVAVVHNGIIDNYLELKTELQKQGYDFKSETDTEVIANLFDRQISAGGNLGQAVLETVSRLEGKYAFVAMLRNGALVAVREHEPLILGIGRGGYYVASDVLGFAAQTDRVIFMENKEFALVESGRLGVYDFGGEPVPHQVTTVAREFGEADKGKFVHFTLKEIHEQPRTILRAGSLNEDEVASVSALYKRAERVYITACGTSYHAALIGAHVMSKETEKEVSVVISSEAKFKPVRYGPETLVMALSQSGETADVLEAVEAAKEKGSMIASLVNVTTSSLARISDAVVGLNCGPEVGVAATKSFTAQVATLYRIVQELSGHRFSAGLEDLPSAVDTTLKSEAQIQALAKRMSAATDVYILGAGLNYYAALEASLKIKELSYVHAEALPGGELKHGPLALIEKGTPVVLLNPKDDTYSNTLASAHEVKSRGAEIIGVSDVESNLYDEWIRLPALEGYLYPPVEVVPMQLLAYFMALERRSNPDYPRNLAKSVTVK
jgi:glucosamine--fructose-6-phosphate aminotransferase (isomerizing)